MSEFKFACPVCGQHITAATGASGTKIDCPTCFRKIVVPQPPASPDSKLIVAAAEDTGRPTTAVSEAVVARPRKSHGIPGVALLLVLLGAAVLAGVFFWGDLFPQTPDPTAPLASAPPTNPPVPPKIEYPVPTNTFWTQNLLKAVIPEEPAGGRIHGEGFKAERTTFNAGNISLRQGKGAPPDLGISFQLQSRQPESLVGKTITVGPKRIPPGPPITLRWKDQEMKPVSQTFTNGYALKLSFDDLVKKRRLIGRIYLALPDADKSFVAGTFEAQIVIPKPKTNAPPLTTAK